MPRVSQKTLGKLNDYLNTISADTQSKCTLCRDTLTHVVNSAAAKTGAPVSTITSALAERVNNGASQWDLVTGQQLRRRVQRVDEGISPKRADKTDSDIEPKECPVCKSHYPGDQDHCPNKCGIEKTEKKADTLKQSVNTVTDAMRFARVAISELKRIRPNDPEKNKAFDHVEQWIKENRS